MNVRFVSGKGKGHTGDLGVVPPKRRRNGMQDKPLGQYAWVWALPYVSTGRSKPRQSQTDEGVSALFYGKQAKNGKVIPSLEI